MSEASSPHNRKDPQERPTWAVLLDWPWEAARSTRPRVREFAQQAKISISTVKAFIEEQRPEVQRTARKTMDSLKQAADAAKPEVNRLIQQAKPVIERAAQRAAEYGREHDEEVRRAAARMARAAGPRWLRLATGAFQAEQSQNAQGGAKKREG